MRFAKFSKSLLKLIASFFLKLFQKKSQLIIPEVVFILTVQLFQLMFHCLCNFLWDQMAIVQGAVTHEAFEIPDYWTFGYDWGVQEISYCSDTLGVVFAHWNWESQNIHSFQCADSWLLFVLNLVVDHCFIFGYRRSMLGIIIFSMDEIWSSFVFFFRLALNVVELNKSSPHERVFAGSVKTFETCFVVGRGPNCLWKLVFHYR